jgi:hypothetical protein
MRGGKKMEDRGMIPRLLSHIYRRARKVEKDSAGATQVEVVMSYYEIYNDRIFDLFKAPEERTPAGLPIRDNAQGKAIVVGLSEKPCTSLKDFEQLYDHANLNRSTSATKLNAHSSRSHAVLCVKVVQITGDEVRVSTASAIDLAGSEDNRRTDNDKDRMVESASINRSLFVLASCVAAISKKQARIPWRDSRLTRVLSLGQNQGLTIMILNLSPLKSAHLDTISSLNFAAGAKKVEVNEIENQPFFREGEDSGKSKLGLVSTGPAMNRQPLRPKLLSQNSHLRDVTTVAPKPMKQFAVYTDKVKPITKPSANISQARAVIQSPKRTSSEALHSISRAAKFARPNPRNVVEAGMSKDAIEALIERKVTEALAAGRAAAEITTTANAQDHASDEMQKRLIALERRVEGQETERAEGLQYLLMAKQHQIRGEDSSALKMYRLALTEFPENEKLLRKIRSLQEKLSSRSGLMAAESKTIEASTGKPDKPRRKPKDEDLDASWHEDENVPSTSRGGPLHEEEDDGFIYRPRPKARKPHMTNLIRGEATTTIGIDAAPIEPSTYLEPDTSLPIPAQTPRTKRLIAIINTRDVNQIKLLKGVGSKKAEAIVNCLCDLDDFVDQDSSSSDEEKSERKTIVKDLNQLGKLKGVGAKTVMNMRVGLGEF